MIRAVMFDWDGTLVDSKEAILASYRDATAEVLGEPFPVTPDDVARILPMRAQESFGSLSSDPKVVETLISAYHRAYLRNSSAMARAFPGVRELLEELRTDGLRIGVVTSKGRDRVDADAQRYRLDGLVDAHVTGDVSAERKPHPGPVLDGLELLGLERHEAVYVGDGPQDVIAGREAGVATVAVLYGFHTAEEIARQQPEHTASTVGQLRTVLATIRARRPVS